MLARAIHPIISKRHTRFSRNRHSFRSLSTSSLLGPALTDTLLQCRLLPLPDYCREAVFASSNIAIAYFFTTPCCRNNNHSTNLPRHPFPTAATLQQIRAKNRSKDACWASFPPHNNYCFDPCEMTFPCGWRRGG